MSGCSKPMHIGIFTNLVDENDICGMLVVATRPIYIEVEVLHLRCKTLKWVSKNSIIVSLERWKFTNCFWAAVTYSKSRGRTVNP